jgi:hypothetical protein
MHIMKTLIFTVKFGSSMNKNCRLKFISPAKKFLDWQTIFFSTSSPGTVQYSTVQYSTVQPRLHYARFLVPYHFFGSWTT